MDALNQDFDNSIRRSDVKKGVKTERRTYIKT